MDRLNYSKIKDPCTNCSDEEWRQCMTEDFGVYYLTLQVEEREWMDDDWFSEVEKMTV